MCNQITALTGRMAKEIALWRYDGEYKVYNCPAWDEMAADGWGLTKPAVRRVSFRAVMNADNGGLTGYFRFIETDEGVQIGVGMRPDLCGRGWGTAFMRLILDFLSREFPGKPVVLEVRAWNRRAVTCYQKTGFVIIEELNKTEKTGADRFIKMKWNHNRERDYG